MPHRAQAINGILTYVTFGSSCIGAAFAQMVGPDIAGSVAKDQISWTFVAFSLISLGTLVVRETFNYLRIKLQYDRLSGENAVLRSENAALRGISAVAAKLPPGEIKELPIT